MRRNVWFMLGVLIGVTLAMLWHVNTLPRTARWEPPQRARKYPLRPSLYFVIKTRAA